jgi:hypothetical protein
LAAANGDPRLAQVIYIKMKLKQHFPQTFAEAFNPPTGLPALYASDLQKMGVQAGSGAPQSYESAVLLILILRRANGGVRFNEDDLGSQAVGYANYNGVSLKMLIDAWGNPLAFFAFPTGNAELDGLNPASSGTRESTNRDPDDP